MALKPGNGDTGGSERDPRLDLLYRDAAREGPPAHLDAAILAAARREVGARPRSVSAQFRRWRVPVSIAAVVVLSASLVTLVSEEGGEILLRDERAPNAPPAAPAAEPAQPAIASGAPEAGGRLAAGAEARKRAAPAPEEFSLRRDEAAATATNEPRREAEREQARSSGPVAGWSLRLDEGPAKATAGVPKSAAEGDARSSAALAAGAETAATPPPVAIGGLISSQSLESAPRPAADAAQRPSATIGIRGSSGETQQPAAAPQAKPMAEKSVVEERARPLMQAPKPVAEEPVVQRKPQPLKRAPAWRGLEQEPPQKWLERLAELRKQGRTREADELLAEFKRRFPDHPLPAGTE